MKSAEIRKTFINFFLNKKDFEHKFVPSAPVVPLDDPTLLFVNAGMNQFKDVFLGFGSRTYKRAVNSQKCIRVSGKHNDLEEVGPSPIHHTLFEMLGNWSFGDYFKAEAIRWAWELLTEIYKLDKNCLYATVFHDDQEAWQLWKSETDIDPTHISRHGEKDNFWEMGDVGPCGPCSEIHYDLGKPLPGRISPPDDGPNSDSGRFIELWNLVFIQFRRDISGHLHELPAKHVDTGAGLERIARVLQNVESNYDTDLFKPIIEKIATLSGVPYNAEKGLFNQWRQPSSADTSDDKGLYIPHRVIADHLRALSFAIADGALPGNEGRGYVLRRILRRAARFCRKLDIHEPFLYELVPTLIEVMGDHYPELKERQQHITHVLRAEEESFSRTLDRGLAFFQQVIEKILIPSPLTPHPSHQVSDTQGIMPEAGCLSGEDAFRLYDTYGFPLDLTELMAREHGLKVDVQGFNRALEAQRELSRQNAKFVAGTAKFTIVSEGEHSEFIGYDTLSVRTHLRMIRRRSEDPTIALSPEAESKPEYAVVLARTPFYAEAGGQVADHGIIRGREFHFKVTDVRQEGDIRLHIGYATRLPEDGTLPDYVEATVDADRRRQILPHHTTTHLLQKALREVLGDHVHQAGSRVSPDYMTFDFTHFEKLRTEQLREVEERVNRWIREDHPVTWRYTDLETSRTQGAMALFGEKYGEVVRMVMIGENGQISSELCGGTHLSRTGEAGLFRIESESAVSTGVRRIEATAGEAAYRKTVQERETLDKLIEGLGSRGSDPGEKLEKLHADYRKLEKEVERLKRVALQGSIRFIEDWGQPISFKGEPILVVSGIYEAANDREALQTAGDKIIEDLKKAKQSGIGLIGAACEDTFIFVAVATQDLVKKGIHAGRLVGAFARKAGGGGGGKPNFATAGSRDLENSQALLRNAKEVRTFVDNFINASKDKDN